MTTCKTCSMHDMVYGRLDTFGIITWNTLPVDQPWDITTWSMVSTVGCAEKRESAMTQGAETHGGHHE